MNARFFCALRNGFGMEISLDQIRAPGPDARRARPICDCPGGEYRLDGSGASSRVVHQGQHHDLRPLP